MGYTIKSMCRSNRAPVWECNASGTQPWSGKYDYQITEEELEAILTFVAFEAQMIGHNEANQNFNYKQENPFHIEFMDGSPHREWNYFYENGCESGRAKKARKNLAEWMSSLPIESSMHKETKPSVANDGLIAEIEHCGAVVTSEVSQGYNGHVAMKLQTSSGEHVDVFPSFQEAETAAIAAIQPEIGGYFDVYLFETDLEVTHTTAEEWIID